jgi:carbonic anhydrase
MASSQHPKITLLTCSDSRVDMEFFRIDPLDTVFTVRNIGNTILANEGSIEY